MAARKQADISCMFCGDHPCTCTGATKPKKAAPAKKTVKTVPVNLEPKEIPAPQQKRAGLSSIAATHKREEDQAKLDDEQSERAALTALFQAGFTLERVGDPRGFESVRPMLNMSPIDIDIAVWKRRRAQCQTSS